MYRSIRLHTRLPNLSAHFQLRHQHQLQHRNTSSISKLQAAFRDPSSPFHIPPGTQGPEFDPTAPPDASAEDALGEAREKLIASGFDPASFWEQHIAWGDQDSFQHVNNARYVQFFESSRIRWMYSLGHELGGPEKAQALIKGQGIGLILKSIEVQFRRPVTYPDTLLIGYRPIPAEDPTKADPTQFQVTASAYSLGQKAYVAHSRETLVWYDYERLRKCDPGEKAGKVVFGRVREARS